jgi:hypothetical protein
MHPNYRDAGIPIASRSWVRLPLRTLRFIRRPIPYFVRLLIKSLWLLVMRSERVWIFVIQCCFCPLNLGIHHTTQLERPNDVVSQGKQHRYQ